MDVLRSEADFSDPGLSRERRWLALFLLVHLVDEHGRMGTAYRRVLRRAARTPGHWAQGRSLGAVRAEVTRWIGVHAKADSVPPWERLADLIHAAVPVRHVPDVLATARHLHGLVTGEATDAPRPSWLDPAVEDVTTALIGGPEWARKHGLPVPRSAPQIVPEPACGIAPAGTPVEVPRPGTPADEDPADEGPSRDRESSAYEMLWAVVRVHRDAEARIAQLEHQVRRLHEENARLTGDVTTWLGDYRPSIPDQDRGPRPRRPVTDRHLSLEDPAPTFTYPLPAELPATHPTAG
ncbi:hypothetical protein GCM10027184_61560 [Saccharothrix stipae]